MNNQADSKLQSTLRLAHVATWDWNFTSHELVRSGFFDPLFGYPEGYDEWTIQTFQKVIDHDDLDLLKEKFHKSIKQQRPLETEFRVKWPNGSDHWLWMRGIITEWNDQNPVHMSGVIMDVTPRIQAESEANKYRQQLEKAQEIASLGYGEFNYKTGELFWSDTIYQLFGLDRTKFELTIENFYTFLPPGYRDEYVRLFEHAKQNDTPFDYIFQLNKPNGTSGFFRQRAKFIKDDKGQLEKVTGIILDVTDQERAKKELQESQDLLEKAQELSRIGYWEFDYPNQTLTWSDKVYEIFGLDPDTFEPTREHFLELVHPDDRDNLRKSQVQALRTDTLFESEYRLIKPTGEIGYFQERGEFVINEHGVLNKLMGAVIDVTDLKEAENQLAKSAQTYRLLFQHNPLPGLIYDYDSLEILEVNKAAIQHYGYTENEFTSISLYDLFLPEDLPELKNRLKQINLKFSNSGIWRNITKNGTIITVDITSVGLQYLNRNCRQIVINDITEQKKEEQERLISMVEGEDRERKRIAMDLHDGMAQYLTAATMNLSAVKNQVAQLPEHKQKQFSIGLTLVKDALLETRNIAQNLMPKAIENFGLVAALSDLFQKAELANNIRIHFEHDIDPLELERQIEINLFRITQEALSNAVKHSGAEKVNVRIFKNGRFLSYLFSDNGKGYQRQLQSTTHHGIGLSSIRMRAQSMLASLDIEGKPGVGTSITIKIPYST